MVLVAVLLVHFVFFTCVYSLIVICEICFLGGKRPTFPNFRCFSRHGPC